MSYLYSGMAWAIFLIPLWIGLIVAPAKIEEPLPAEPCDKTCEQIVEKALERFDD